MHFLHASLYTKSRRRLSAKRQAVVRKLSGRSRPGEEAAEGFVHQLRVGLAFRRFHHGAFESVEGAFFSGAEFLGGLCVGGDGVAAPLLQLAGVGRRGGFSSPGP